MEFLSIGSEKDIETLGARLMPLGEDSLVSSMEISLKFRYFISALLSSDLEQAIIINSARKRMYLNLFIKNINWRGCEHPLQS
jgi:hypothetical protein